MAKLIEGLWDCPYCGAKGIGGLEKHCTNCGHPQDKGTKFYVGEKKIRLSEEKAEKVGTKADWVCSFCGSYNPAAAEECANCGAPREENDGNYFTQKTEEKSVAKAQPAPRPRRRRPLLGVIALALLALLVFSLLPKNRSGKVDSLSWERAIQVEEYSAVREDGWDLPQGASLVEAKQEVRSYNRVLDHYETREKQVPYQVFDGYDVSYKDNGNGTFTEVSTERYRTEYRTETYEEAVYIDVPVFDTKYYYDIDRWHYIGTESTSGGSNAPVWPELKLAQNQRELRRSEEYVVIFRDGKSDRTYRYTCPLSEWEGYREGQSVDFTVTSGRVSDIKK